MANPVRWHEAKLFDLQGTELGICRVPADPLPPHVIMWGNRYFTLRVPHGEYGEVKVHLVLIEHMYVTVEPEKKLPFRKAAR